MQHRRSQGPPSIITALPPSFMFTSTTITTDPDTDQWHWQLTQPAVSEGGQISLRGLPPVVVLEVLFGVQQRVRGGAKILDVTLRTVCNTLRREQVPQVAACPAQRVPGKPARALLAALGCHVRRALTDPGRERAGDSWDLALFGHRGRLSFTGISQPWLAHAAKAWAGEQLPRHRGGGASNVRTKVNALARLAESLRIRDDHGLSPDRPGRDLPTEIMAVLCANLDSLHPAEVRTATQLGIDTGRRPEDTLNLPLDCCSATSRAPPCWSMTTPKPTGSAAACRSARRPLR